MFLTCRVMEGPVRTLDIASDQEVGVHEKVSERVTSAWFPRRCQQRDGSQRLEPGATYRAAVSDSLNGRIVAARKSVLVEHANQ